MNCECVKKLAPGTAYPPGGLFDNMEDMDKIDVLEIFKLAERVEECAVEFYLAVSKRVHSPVVVKVFTFIAGQELKHGAMYAALREQVTKELSESAREIFAQPAKVSTIESVMDRFHADLKGRLEKFMNAEKQLVAEAANITDPIRAVDLAIFFEETTVELYRELQKHVCLASKPRVEVIINEEKRHLRDFISLKARILRATIPMRAL